MHYICPSCNTENQHPYSFSVEEYICKSCSKLINPATNRAGKIINKPTENVVLNVGQKGVLNGTEYSVINIVVKKYGQNIFWREYALIDQNGNYASLSESDGHWIFLTPLQLAIKDHKHYAEYDGKNYRWYETTPCATDSATGFFEGKVNFKLSTYKEFVNGTEMISREQNGNDLEYYKGNHISKYTIKSAFKIDYLPNYSGIGIVQPFYVNFKQAINILGISALLICLVQLYIYTSRTNTPVFEQKILFEEMKDKEFISKSFTLSGGTAPLKIEMFSAVENSWANVQLSLVNEKTNEAVYTSKDIEKYSGISDGETWTEGSDNENLNICGVSAGTYHFTIAAERETAALPVDNFLSPDSKFMLSRDVKGVINATNNLNGEPMVFTDDKTLDSDTSKYAKELRAAYGNGKINEILNNEALRVNQGQYNTSVDIKATWMPVSFWNFGFILIIIAFIMLLIWVGRYFFNVSKWTNSSNSPYPQS